MIFQWGQVSSRTMSDSNKPGSDGPIVRALGVVLAPLVVVAEWGGQLLMSFFAAAEKLDPLVLLRRVIAPLEPFAMRVGRFFGEMFALPVKAISLVLDLLFGWIAPAVRRIDGVVRRLGTWFASIGHAALVATATLRSRVARAFEAVRSVARKAFAPIRRARARASDFARRVRSRLSN